MANLNLDAARAALERMNGLDYKYGGWWRTNDDDWTGEEDVPEESRLALHDLLVLVREAVAE